MLEKAYVAFGEFPCVAGCTACCKGILSLSVPELHNIHQYLGKIPAAQAGCPFRKDGGCSVYPVRPFMCRLFGFHYLHPGLLHQPFCPRKELFRPGDAEQSLLKRYLRFCDEKGFVLLGEPPDSSDPGSAIEDNREALAKFPDLLRFRDILTGSGRK